MISPTTQGCSSAGIEAAFAGGELRNLVYLRIAGAAAQPIAGCTPARYRGGGVTHIRCRSQRAAGDASRRIAVRLRLAGAAAQPIAGCTPARYRGSGVTHIRCRSQRAAGDASRRIAVRIRIAGAAAQPIGCHRDLYQTIGSPTSPCRTGIPLELWFGTPTKPARAPYLTHRAYSISSGFTHLSNSSSVR